MSKLTRAFQKVFARLATNNGQFGSAQLGTKVTTTDDTDVIQALAAFENGWLDATIEAQRLLTLEELQALHFLTTRQLAYIFQEGVAEWNIETEYHTNSLVKFAGTSEIYVSITDDNVGNLPTDAANWKLALDLLKAVDTDNSISVDGEIALFDGTDGRTLKRATTTGLLKAADGVLAAAIAGTDYFSPANTVPIGSGGTGQTTAAAAFNAIKQAATTSASGAVELATNSEALAGSDTTRAVTSAGLASSKSLSSTGYMKFAGGFTVAWGSITTTSSQTTVSFPISFSSVYGAFAQPNDAEFAGGAEAAHTNDLTTSNMKIAGYINNSGSSIGGANWMAWGRT